MNNFVGLKNIKPKVKTRNLKPCQWEGCRAYARMLYCKAHSYDAAMMRKYNYDRKVRYGA